MFQYEVRHKTVERMRHVDALSRRDCVLAIRNPLAERLERAQKHDEKFEAINTVLANGSFKDYELISRLIYKGSGDLRRLDVPKGMINDIISQAHEQGHFAVRKTMEQIQQQYFFKKFKKS